MLTAWGGWQMSQEGGARFVCFVQIKWKILDLEVWWLSMDVQNSGVKLRELSRQLKRLLASSGNVRPSWEDLLH